MFKNLSLEVKIRVLMSISITLNVILAFVLNILVYFANNGFNYLFNVIALIVGFLVLFVFFKIYHLNPKYRKHLFVLGFFVSVFFVIYSITLVVLDYHF